MSAPLTDHRLLERLIAFDTTSSKSNLQLVDDLCAYLERPGVRIERHSSPDGEKANLVVRLGPPASEERDGLVLSGHMDVVPAGSGWNSDPFVLTEKDDGTWAARGSCDMKGFLALAMNVMARLDPERLEAPLVLLFTYDEELGTLGSRHFVETWTSPEPLPRRTIVGEPTGMRVVRMHKGHIKLRLDFAGKSAHSGYPHLGKNALAAAARAIVALVDLDATLREERPASAEHFPDAPFVPLNVARCEGGVAINIVPEHASVDVGLRHLPGVSAESLVERVRQAVAGALGEERFELALLGDSPPMIAPEGTDLEAELCRHAGILPTTGVSFATDGGWLQQLDMQCLLFGPGSITVAHRPDEFIPVHEFARAREVLEGLVQRFCLGAPL